MDLLIVIARAADICLKPWSYSVVDQEPASSTNIEDLNFRIECRDAYGQREPNRDLNLEIYKSGNEINLMISWLNNSSMPILWQGRHPVWIHSETGERCVAPYESAQLEALGRRLRSLLNTQ